MLGHALRAVATRHGEAIRETFGVSVVVPATPFPRVTMAQANEILRERGWQSSTVDLDPAGERLLSARIAEQTGHGFVFVTRYPASVRPFYHMRPADAPDETLSFDLLWKGREITTGAQREHRYEVLLAQAADKGMSTEPMRDYLNAFALPVGGKHAQQRHHGDRDDGERQQDRQVGIDRSAPIDIPHRVLEAGEHIASVVGRRQPPRPGRPRLSQRLTVDLSQDLTHHVETRFET